MAGSTCYHHPNTVEWESEDGRWLLLKHSGHTEYLNRTQGSGRCKTSYWLYDMNQPKPDRRRREPVVTFEGRLSNAKKHHIETTIIFHKMSARK